VIQGTDMSSTQILKQVVIKLNFFVKIIERSSSFWSSAVSKHYRARRYKTEFEAECGVENQHLFKL